MFSRDDLVPFEDAAVMVAAGGVEVAQVLRPAVGKTLGVSLLLGLLTLGTFARHPKIHDVRHPITR